MKGKEVGYLHMRERLSEALTIIFYYRLRLYRWPLRGPPKVLVGIRRQTLGRGETTFAARAHTGRASKRENLPARLLF
jgi:hypothetical protein